MPEDLNEIKLNLVKTPFNLDHTLSCGQVFRWEKHGDWWQGIVNDTFVKIRQENDILLFQKSSERIAAAFLQSYFRLDDDLPSIYNKITEDNFVRQAVKKFYGLRLMRQDPWECLISYICATNKNIPAIKNMIANLCKHFGRKTAVEEGEFFTFPEPPDLAQASVKELKLCKLGFRAKRAKETSKLVSRGAFSLDALKTSPYEKAKKVLTRLPGVGSKVADCVLLFSYGKLEAFPIDVWMKRIILEYYGDHFESKFVERARASKSPSPREYDVISSFGRSYFGEYVGYAQEYLYHFRRCQP